MKKVAYTLLVLGGLFGASASPARASSILSGTGDVGGNCVPFGCPGLLPGKEYQQVYDGGLFPESMFIDTLSFFNHLSLPGEIHQAMYEISLSTTSRSVNGLDLVELGNNVGSDRTLFFSGMLGGPGSIVGGAFTIAGSSFAYDPHLGNLLLDVRILDVAPGIPPTVFLDFDGESTASSRACAGEPCGASSGLVTGFGSQSPAPVPEPSTILLFGTALAAAGVRHHRRVSLSQWYRRRR